jgi:LacI family transcriptional regulator
MICGNGRLAIGALLEARVMGIEVPHDLSIIGLDDMSLAGECDPAPTTMKVDNAEIGRLVANHLLARLSGGAALWNVIILPTLIKRRTTALPLA